MTGNKSLLQIKDLKVEYAMEGESLKAVGGVSLEVKQGQCFGLVGESGSGKSTIAKAILKLLPSNANMTGGSIVFKDKEISRITEREMDRIRWKEISFVSQSAMNALNPVARISREMIETIRAHEKGPSKEIRERCEQLFEKVGLNRNRLSDYPHQFSGGMRQRAIIAMAIALNPDLIIADEPTTALDVIMQAQIINLLRTLSEEKKISLFLITHDIAIVAEVCRAVGVMYAGRLMEYGGIEKVFNNPHHPYTMGLKGAFPTIKELKKSLISIPGSPPRLLEESSRCGFSERCPFSVDRCRSETPGMTVIEEDHYAACHRWEDAPQFSKKIADIFGSRLRG
jgi:peptide/nickel transport system ATP-binding protein